MTKDWPRFPRTNEKTMTGCNGACTFCPYPELKDNLIDLTNELGQEKMAGNAGKITAWLTRFNLIIIDELRYLPLSKKYQPIALSSDLKALRANLSDHYYKLGPWGMASALGG